MQYDDDALQKNPWRVIIFEMGNLESSKQLPAVYVMLELAELKLPDPLRSSCKANRCVFQLCISGQVLHNAHKNTINSQPYPNQDQNRGLPLKGPHHNIYDCFERASS